MMAQGGADGSLPTVEILRVQEGDEPLVLERQAWGGTREAGQETFTNQDYSARKKEMVSSRT